MRVKIKDYSGFCSSVFGADSLLASFPELRSFGVDVEQMFGGFYYIMKNGRAVSDSAFFSEEEMRFLEEVI